MPRSSVSERLIEQSRFIFKGTVRRVDTTNVSRFSASHQTVVVRVDAVMRGAQAMQDLTGSEITVVLRKDTRLGKEKTLYFFTNAFLYSEHVVVREIGHLDWKRTRSSHNHIEEKIRWVEQKPLRERIANAEIIVVGRVKALNALEGTRGPKTRHDPDWWAATVQASSYKKGSNTGKDIQILFSNSRELAMKTAPKFRPGDRGIWILRKEYLKPVGTGYYIVVNPLDFHPMDQLGQINQLIESSSKDP